VPVIAPEAVDAELDLGCLTVLPEGLQEFAAHRVGWLNTARPNQIPPETFDWFLWLLCSGRGFGKTRCGAEETSNRMVRIPEYRTALLAPTTGDIRDTMVEGESGLLSCVPPKLIHKWNRSLLELTLTNGSRAKGYSSESPERLRGPQHHFAWLDEVCAFINLQETIDMLMMGLRLGEFPQMLCTTTPKPLQLLKDWVRAKDTHLVTGSTFENMDNLPEKFRQKLVEKYEGTRLGRQELYAEILEDFENAFLSHEQILHVDKAPGLRRIVIGVDPAGSHRKGSDLTGIIAGGTDMARDAYVLGDYSLVASPEKWASRVVDVYHDLEADLIVAEKNYGGEMVMSTIHGADENVPVKLVHASRGKQIRAEPVIMKYEQGKIFHVGYYEDLESQLCAFTPEGYELENSPDRADALVWCMTELLLGRNYLTPVLPESFDRASSPARIS